MRLNQEDEWKTCGTENCCGTWRSHVKGDARNEKRKLITHATQIWILFLIRPHLFIASLLVGINFIPL